MHLARVIGRVVSTVKQDSLNGVTLQWVQGIRSNGEVTGKRFVAVDPIGVGPSETVYYVTSREASLILPEPFAAVDAAIVGRVDWVDVDGEQRLGESA